MRDENDAAEYRSRLYSNYGTIFQDAPRQFDEQASTRWERAYK